MHRHSYTLAGLIHRPYLTCLMHRHSYTPAGLIHRHCLTCLMHRHSYTPAGLIHRHCLTCLMHRHSYTPAGLIQTLPYLPDAQTLLHPSRPDAQTLPYVPDAQTLTYTLIYPLTCLSHNREALPSPSLPLTEGENPPPCLEEHPTIHAHQLAYSQRSEEHTSELQSH